MKQKQSAKQQPLRQRLRQVPARHWAGLAVLVQVLFLVSVVVINRGDLSSITYAKSCQFINQSPKITFDSTDGVQSIAGQPIPYHMTIKSKVASACNRGPLRYNVYAYTYGGSGFTWTANPTGVTLDSGQTGQATIYITPTITEPGAYSFFAGADGGAMIFGGGLVQLRFIIPGITISNISPAPNAEVRGRFVLSARAYSAPKDIDTISFYLNGVLQSQSCTNNAIVTNFPFDCSVRVGPLPAQTGTGPSAPFNLEVKACSRDGSCKTSPAQSFLYRYFSDSAQSNFVPTSDGPLGDGTPDGGSSSGPSTTLQLLSPTDGQTLVNPTFTMRAQASESTTMEFYINNRFIVRCTDKTVCSAGYNKSSLPAGPSIITVRAPGAEDASVTVYK